MKKTNSLALLTTVVSLALFQTVACADKPSHGSIEFGTKVPPKIETSSALTQFKNLYANVAAVAIPTVVSITSTQIDTVISRNPYEQFYGSPFDFFFGNPQQGRAQPQMKEQRQTGIGSGVIVSKDGYILTNSHVIKGASEITVTLSDDRQYEATIIGVDTLSDVGVIKIKEKVENLPVAAIGSSSVLRPGDLVMAVGTPFNLSSTVTTGIVSALGRHTGEGDEYQNFIQTDAAINPGNSGGALVNMNGELIGINTMIYTKSGGYMGIGFAIPIDMASRIMEQLIYDGKVSRGWLGVSIGNMDQSMMDALGLKERGVLINEVFEKQPAAKAGIKGGDVILSLDGIRTQNANDLRNAVASIAPGKEISVKLIRDGNEMTFNAILFDREKAGKDEDISATDSKKDGSNELGLSLKKSETGEGVVIVSLDPKGVAAKSGLAVGDEIREIKTAQNVPFRKIANETELNAFVKEVVKGGSFVVKIVRQNRALLVAMKRS